MTSSPIPISIALLCKNAETYLPACLAALAEFDEVLLLDNGSTDSSPDIARQFANVSVHCHPEFDGFGPMKDRAARLARHDWILTVDSDEILTPALVNEIRQLKREPDCLYRILRHNHYRGQHIQSGDWHPDWVRRLYHRDHSGYGPALVHESLQLAPGMRVIDLRSPMRHYTYDSAEQLIAKMQRYSTLYADAHRGEAASPFKAFYKGIWAFLRSYLLKGGWREGYAGLVIAVHNATYSFYKYAKLYEANRPLGPVAERVRSDSDE